MIGSPKLIKYADKNMNLYEVIYIDLRKPM